MNSRAQNAAARLIAWLPHTTTWWVHCDNYTGYWYTSASTTQLCSCIRSTSLWHHPRHHPISRTSWLKQPPSAHVRDFGPAAVVGSVWTASDATKIRRTRQFVRRAPAAWNGSSLPPSLQQSNTASFKRHLKTFLFQRAFSDWFLVLFMYFKCILSFCFLFPPHC